MAGKGKFIYIFDEDGEKRIVVKDSSFVAPEGAEFFPLSQFSTDDLLKVRAQIATALECRMDLDDVTEQNLERLKTQIRSAKAEAVAKLARQTLDRLDVVAADEKRAKTRLEIIQDELRNRMVADEMSEMKFAGLLTVTYKPETVFSVGEEGWTPVYSNIVADSVANQIADGGVVQQLANELDVSVDTVKEVTDGLVKNVRGGLLNPEAFAILQKRLTGTTLNDLLKQGYDLPEGIKQSTIRKVKTKRLK